MKTVAVGGSNKKPDMGGLSIFLLTIALALSSGGIDKQEGVKIGLGRTTEEEVVRVSENDIDVVYFGFDLRSSPIEDACIHAPDWDKTEVPCGFMGVADLDYAELRALATRYGAVE